MAVALAAMVGLSPSPSAADGEITFQATIDGRQLSEVSNNKPLELHARDTPLELTVKNGSSQAVEVRYVALEGGITGFNFFSYVTRIDLQLAPGETGDRQFVLDLGDLDTHATGLLPSSFGLLDPNRSVMTQDDFTADVDGSLASAYGIFGVAIIAITGLLLAGALLRLFSNRLPQNRWQRGVYFAFPGFGIGLTLTFGFSVLRVFAPGAGVWISLVLVLGAIGFILGYLTPNPYVEDPEDDEALHAELDARLMASVARDPRETLQPPPPSE
ncbi:MAG: hypothetical protein QOC92_1637 [Acidimicrobiaceae bacterium]